MLRTSRSVRQVPAHRSKPHLSFRHQKEGASSLVPYRMKHPFALRGRSRSAFGEREGVAAKWSQRGLKEMLSESVSAALMERVIVSDSDCYRIVVAEGL